MDRSPGRAQVRSQALSGTVRVLRQMLAHPEPRWGPAHPQPVPPRTSPRRTTGYPKRTLLRVGPSPSRHPRFSGLGGTRVGMFECNRIAARRSRVTERRSLLLEISPEAAELLHAARATEGLPEYYGVRVYAHSDDDGWLFVRFTFVEGPGEGDHLSDPKPIA